MRTIKHILSVCILLAGVSYMAPQKANAQGVSVSFQVFYDDMSPYGTWVNNPAYGYVWIPDAGAGFSPYATNGYWVYTDYGWTWVSNYSWGWAPFHYGRWYADPYYGWVWVPGDEWGPGWVTWRQSDGYYGWVSMGPSGYYAPDNSWTFVEVNNFGGTTINNYYINRSQNTTIIKNTTVINNSHTHGSGITYNAGPDRTEVEKHSGKKITPFVVKENTSHGQQMSNGQVLMYKPRVEKNGTGSKPAPSKVSELKDVKGKQNDKVPVPNKQPVTTPKEQPTKQPQQTQPKKQYQPQPKQQPTQQPKQQQQQPKQQPQPKQQQPTQQPKQQPQQQPKQQPQQQPKQQQPQQQPQPKQPHKPKTN